MEHKQQLWTKAYIIALVTSIGINLNRNFLMSTLSIYSKQITSSDAYTGLMTGVFTLAALAVRLFVGKMLDTIGRKKVLITGLGLTIAVAIGYCLTDQIVPLLVLRAIDGVAFGITSTAIATVITDIIPESRLLEGIGYSGVVATITAALGPSIALMVVGESYQQFSSLFILCLAVSALTLTGSFSLPYVKPDGRISKEGIPAENKLPEKTFTLSLMISVLLLFLVSSGQSVYISFAALYGISLGFSQVGLFFTANAIGMLLSRLFASRVVDKMGSNRVIFISLFSFSGCLLATAFLSSNLIFILIGFISGIVVGILLPLLNVRIISGVAQSSRGRANAMYYAGLDLGYGLGSILWGAVALHYGYSTIYVLAACVVLMALLIFIGYKRADA